MLPPLPLLLLCARRARSALSLTHWQTSVRHADGERDDRSAPAGAHHGAVPRPATHMEPQWRRRRRTPSCRADIIAGADAIVGVIVLVAVVVCVVVVVTTAPAAAAHR